MLLKSTRNDNKKVGALRAVLKGISDEGGLFIPTEFNRISMSDLLSMQKLSYQELSAKILCMFFDEISDQEMLDLTTEAYASFDSDQVVPFRKLDDTKYVLELFHGPTLAFKDIALQVLPRLMSKALAKNDTKHDILILTATSGDTGKAALEGFKDVARIKIAVYYPSDGVSKMQKLQMCTQEGKNTFVFSVNGNFDDTQNGVKHIFTNQEMIKKIEANGYHLSSANSINIGRLTPQIVYYFWSYLNMIKDNQLKPGDTINVVVPTGNFGNILAAYYAKKMGLPIKKFICASNSNRVLTDFFNNQEYNLKNRDFVKTMSPSMDILISSNLERLIADLTDNSNIVNQLFNDLKQKQIYSIKDYIYKTKLEDFYANWSSEKRTSQTIKDTYEKYNYLIDPHTAVAMRVCDDYIEETGDTTPCVIVSTASPYKFSDSVLDALGQEVNEEAFKNAKALFNYTNVPIPQKIKELDGKEILHKEIIEKDEMFDSIFKI